MALAVISEAAKEYRALRLRLIRMRFHRELSRRDNARIMNELDVYWEKMTEREREEEVAVSYPVTGPADA